MASENIPLQSQNNIQKRPDHDCQNCRMSVSGNSDKGECLMETIRSQWAAPFEETRYCNHPSAKQFVNFVNSYRPIFAASSHGNATSLLHMNVAGDMPNEIFLPDCPPMNAKQQKIVNEVLAALEADRLELPVLPEMALKVRNLLDDPDSSAGQFVQLLSTDLAISLYLIKAANSAALSNGHPVGNLHDAIPLLGYRMLYSMVMNITMTHLFRANSPLIQQKLQALWKHSRAVAANCYVLAQHHKHLKPEDAVLAGLVHEIGALPLYLYADRHHPDMDSGTLEELIKKFSAPVGAKLLRSWSFPDELIDVVAHHDELQRITRSEVADYVDVVTMANLQIQGAEKAVAWKNILAAERLGYYAEDCKNFVPNHTEQFVAANCLLGLDMAQAA